MFILDVVIAWALYILFKTVSRELSRLTAWFRLVYTVFLGVGAIFFFVIIQLINAADYLKAFDPGQLDAQVMLMLDAFNYAWLIGLACFGIHLILIGSMMLASHIAPKALGVVLVIAGAAYVIDTVANALLTNYSEYETAFLAMVAVPAVIAELAFTLWLLLKAGKEQETPAPRDASQEPSVV